MQCARNLLTSQDEDTMLDQCGLQENIHLYSQIIQLHAFQQIVISILSASVSLETLYMYTLATLT